MYSCNRSKTVQIVRLIFLRDSEGAVLKKEDVQLARSVEIYCKPSLLAEQFLHSTCGSLSDYESGYSSDASGRLPTHTDAASIFAFPSVGFAAGEEEEEEEEVFAAFSRAPRLPRQMTVHPTTSPSPFRTPSPHRKGHTIHTHRGLMRPVGATNLALPTSPIPIPSHHTQHADLTASLPATSHYLAVPTQPRRSKSPALFRGWRQRQKGEETRRNNGTIDPRDLARNTTDDLVVCHRSFGYQLGFTEFEPGHTISHPIHRLGDPPSVQLRDRSSSLLLRRNNAMKRTSLLHLGVTRPSYDVSRESHHVQITLEIIPILRS